MARITILGGTGYAGGAIAREAAGRGHQVTAVSRAAATEPVAGVDYVRGDAQDAAVLEAAFAEADVVVCALAPRGELAGDGAFEKVTDELASRALATGTRLGVVGGAGSLLVSPTGPRLFDTDGFPAEYQAEARTMGAVLEALRATPEDLDWFYVSPAAFFGAHAPGEATGTFRLGDDQLLVDGEGNSAISGADFAAAFVDEIDAPAHRRRRFTVAY